MSANTPGLYGNSRTSPPSVADHPAKVYPDLVGDAGAEIDPFVMKFPSDIDVPLIELKLTR
jgi:hypothetical protein